MKINLSFDTDDAKDRNLLRALLDELCPGIVNAKEPKKPRAKHEPTPEEIEERNAASKMWRDEHKELYNARMRAYRKKQKEKNQAQDH